MDEVGLVEVAGLERYVWPVDSGAGGDESQNLLKAADAAEEFGRQANFVAEDVDKVARADADLIGDGGDFLRFGCGVKFAESESDGCTALRLTRGDREQMAFEDLRFAAWRRSFEKLFANLRCGSATPEGVEAGVLVVEFAERKFQEVMGTTGFEVDAGDACAGGCVDPEWLRVWSADDAIAEKLAAGEGVVGEDRKAAGAEVEDEFNGAVGEQALFRVRRGRSFHHPDHFDEAVERGTGFITEGQHGASVLPFKGGTS